MTIQLIDSNSLKRMSVISLSFCKVFWGMQMSKEQKGIIFVVRVKRFCVSGLSKY